VLFESGQDYGVLSWNVFKSKKKNWFEDFQRLHAIYDVLLLQEAKINFQTQALDAFDLDYSWVFGESFALDRCGSSCGVLTGSRVHTRHAFNRHGPVREPLLNTPKSAAFSFYDIADSLEQFLIINAHFVNFRSLKAFERQLFQIAEILHAHKGPVLFAGDFNTWSIGRREALFACMKRQGMENVEFANETRRFLTLDYIFSRGLKIREAHLLHDIRSSDHTPLALWFRLNEASEGGYSL